MPTSETAELPTAYLRVFADPERNNVTGPTIFCNFKIKQDNMDQPRLAERHRDGTNLSDADENKPLDANAKHGECKVQLDNAFQEAKSMLVEMAINSKTSLVAAIAPVGYDGLGVQASDLRIIQLGQQLWGKSCQ